MVDVADFSGNVPIRLTCKDCSLAELCLPRGLSLDDMERFEAMVDQRPAMARGKILYQTGDVFTGLYAVKSGSFKTTISASDGEDQITGFYLPGELFGFDGFDDNHSCSAISLEHSSACELPLSSIDQLVVKIPNLRRELDRLMAREITADQSMLLQLSRRTAEQRLAAFIVSLSTRFRQRGFSGTEFSLSMSRHDIANYLGLAAETVSRLFRRFNEKHLASANGRTIIIQDFEALHRQIHGHEERQIPTFDQSN
ncbi:MAG: fumarate/nitrate reduction transcriptional regulator Fnr [Pseudomonadota bacterium]|nr:fumarate/nitrate reduction transcriptional regulator Fnr [Pseudomonadota bacterium]